jgi:hypothetical protein
MSCTDSFFYLTGKDFFQKVVLKITDGALGFLGPTSSVYVRILGLNWIVR